LAHALAPGPIDDTNILRMTRPTRLNAEPAHSAPVAPRLPWELLSAAGVIGLVVGGLIIGGLWLENGGGGGTRIDSKSVTLPSRIAEFVPFDQVELNKTGQAGAANVARVKSWDDQSSKRLSKSNSGAGALVRAYADKDLRNQISVLAVRAPAENPQFVPYQDANTLGLVHAPEEEEQFSEVSCVIRNDPTQAGTAPPLNSVHTTSCRRSSDTLTVEIRPTGDISNEPQRVANLVDEVWDTLN
jgi:hypothetical protein